MKDEGVEVLTVTDDVLSAFFATGRGAWKDGYGKLYSEDLLKRVSAAVEEYRANQNRVSQ